MTIADSATCFLEEARRYQNDLLCSFPKRPDAILQLVEALACAEKPTSVVELSQERAFERTFSNVHKAIDALSASAVVEGCLVSDKPLPSENPPGKEGSTDEYPKDLSQTVVVDPQLFLNQTREWTQIFDARLPEETNRPFRLYVVDASPEPKPFAQTLADRGFLPGSGPVGTSVTIGLQASVVVALPEKAAHEAMWALPLMVNRIPTNKTPCLIAEEQLAELARLPQVRNTLSVVVADRGYSGLKPQSPDQVIVARSRRDRLGRRPHQLSPEDLQAKRGRGRPRKYEGETIRFADAIPKGDPGGPDEEYEREETKNGLQVTVFISRWNSVYVHGREDLVDVVKVEFFLKDDPGKALFEDPLLLIISGKRRGELSSVHAYEAYLRRFDIEHFFRFQKQKLLFNGFQTAELQRQVNWWWICQMSYWLLYLVRKVAAGSNRPWQPKRNPNVTASPSETKRVFASQIFPDLGSPSSRPLSRGKSQGRAKGYRLSPRIRKKPVKKKPPDLRKAS